MNIKISKEEKQKEISKIVTELAYEILDEIISPICDIGNVIADCNLATINDYTMGDEKEINEIINKIIEKYNLEEGEGAYLSNIMTEDMPLNLISLMIIEEHENKHGL